jgi:hypothetical protein
MTQVSAYYVVRDFPRNVGTRDRNEYSITVHHCPRPGWTSYRVCIHGPQFTTIVADFDHHYGRYGSDRDELRVSLSAIGHACAVAYRLAELLPWQVLFHAECVDPKLKKGLLHGQEAIGCA